MGTPKARLFLTLNMALVVSACAQSISSSYLLIDQAVLTDQLRDDLVAKVYAKAEMLGGECKLLNPPREYHTCTVDSGMPSVRLAIGYTTKGEYGVFVSSTFGHWFPPSEQKVTSGAFIGETQKELERWMRTLVPEEAVIRAERTYVDYDSVHRF